MSDVGLNFSALDIFVYGSLIALPLTTILLVVLLWRRVTGRGARWALNAGFTVVGPIWAIGAGLLAWLWIDDILERERAASRHFTLTSERTIDGVALPPGSDVSLNGYDRLASVTLPAGATLPLDGATWAGVIEFRDVYETSATVPARISVGVPVADAAFDDYPCRAGQAVSFWGPGGLHSCMLAQDTLAQADIADAEHGRRPVRFLCAAERTLELQPGVGKQIKTCTLAVNSEVQGILCAAGTEIEIYDSRLISCKLAAAQNFNGLEIPAGSILHFTDTPQRVAQFALPEMNSPLPAFGMDLPSHVQVSICRDRWTVDQVAVPEHAYVEIAGVKLTSYLNFDCGLFHFGSLFEDTRIRGEIWASGRSVFREDLGLPPTAKP